MTKTNYIEIPFSLTEEQKQKIASAYKNKRKVSIKVIPANLGEGEDTLYLTKAQFNRLEKALKASQGMTLSLSYAQIRHNVKQGGQLASIAARALPFILPVAKKVLPALGLGALSGLADKAVKSIFGDGMYLSKNGQTARVETDGAGLYLKSVPGSFKGSGMFLVQNGQVQDGSGLLSSIPLIGPLLKMII